MSDIGAVFTATETAGYIRKIIERSGGKAVQISVTRGSPISINFRSIYTEFAIGTTIGGYAVFISLGNEHELETKYPTIMVAKSLLS